MGWRCNKLPPAQPCPWLRGETKEIGGPEEEQVKERGIGGGEGCHVGESVTARAESPSGERGGLGGRRSGGGGGVEEERGGC